MRILYIFIYIYVLYIFFRIYVTYFLIIKRFLYIYKPHDTTNTMTIAQEQPRTFGGAVTSLGGGGLPGAPGLDQ
jgi:hypothetical protein